MLQPPKFKNHDGSAVLDALKSGPNPTTGEHIPPTMRQNHLPFLIAIGLVTVLTWAIGLLDMQYTVEKRLAFDSGFPGDTSLWKATGEAQNIEIADDAIRLSRQAEGRSYAQRTFDLPPAEELQDRKLKVQGSVDITKQPTVTDPEQEAAFMIWFLDETSTPTVYLNVAKLDTEIAGTEATRIVSIPEDARYFTLAFNTGDSDGDYALTDASVDVISTNPTYQIISPIIYFCWLVIAAIVIFWLFRNAGGWLSIGLSLLVVGTFIGVLLPETITVGYVLPAYESVARVLAITGNEPLEVMYKIGHFVFFTLVALLIFLNLERLRLGFAIALSYLLLLAVGTEGLQLHLFDRTTRMSDIIIDLLGVLTGMALAWVTLWIVGHEHPVETEN